MNTRILRRGGLWCAAVAAAVATASGGCFYKEYEVVGAGGGDATTTTTSSSSSSGSPAVCAPVGGLDPVACDQGNPTSIAVDNSTIYWTNEDTGEVMSAPNSGGAPVAIATGEVQPCAVLPLGNSVYWVTRGGELRRKRLSDGTIANVDSNLHPACTLAGDPGVGGAGATIYYFQLNDGDTYNLIRRPLGGALNPIQIATGKLPKSLTSGGGIAWINDADGNVFGGQPAPATLSEIAINATPCGVAAFGGFAAITVPDKGEITIASLSTQQPLGTTMVGGKPCLTATGVKGLFWADDTSGELMRKIDPMAGMPQSVAKTGERACSIATDSAGVYWTTCMAGSTKGHVFRVAL